jgi:ADP-heptose:LPS heptosyltransferase
LLHDSHPDGGGGDRELQTVASFANARFAMPDFQSLSDVAAFIYESGRFVGNDSGLAHLASNVGRQRFR